MKKMAAILCVIGILLSICSCGNDKTEIDDDNIQETQSISVEENSSETNVEESETIELLAGEIGDYGVEVIINEGTEFEEVVCQYRVPVGTYIVTNKGEYMSQFNVYSIETHITEDGWEEPAEVFFVELIGVGMSKTVTIEEGQYIEIHEPAFFELTEE